MKKDEIIRRLEKIATHATHFIGEQPFVMSLDDGIAVKDAIALLKEQGHGETFIVIDNKTGEEADTYDIALHEDWAKHLCYCDMEGWAIEEDGTLLLLDECGRFEYADRERFKVKWDADGETQIPG